MSHVHTGPHQHDTTVSAYIVRLDTPTPSLMLHRHKKLGKYLQFGGHVELDEDPWQAITHELDEESGYDIAQLQVLQPHKRLTSLSSAVLHPYPVALMTHRFGNLDHYHTDIAYAFVTYEPPAGVADAGESTDTKTFTPQSLKALSLQEIPEDVREIGLFVLDECLNSWEQVPAR